MPVAKTNGNGKMPEPQMPPQMEEKKECCHPHFMKGCCSNSLHFGRKLLWTLVGILLVYGIVFLGTLVRNNIQKYYYIGQAEKPQRTIVVQGQGKVAVKPDVAVTTMGMINDAATVAEAQQKNTEVMNKLVEKLKALGIGEKDIQTTNYNIYPQYDYTADKGQVLKGYQVNQSVTVKIRDLSKANQILGLAGEVGANNVSGLQFTIDDREVYKTQARELALKQVAEKARSLSKSLGVKMVSVVSFDEYENGSYPVSPMYAKEMSYGLGGASPDVQVGTNEILLNVNVTFEIR